MYRPFLLSTVLLTSVAASPSLAENNACTVESVRGGIANVWRDGQAIQLNDGMRLANSDRIETGIGSSVQITCTDEMRITVGPQTSIDLGQISGGDQSWSAFILDGIGSFARPLFGGDRFEVRTPSAVASVRSTEWIVEVDAGASTVFVDSGAVAVTSATTSVVLETGQGIDIRADGAADPVKNWGPARVSATKERLGTQSE